MKRILRRVKLNFSKQIGRVLLKCVVFTILFSILFTSLYVNKVSNNLENSIIKNFDIYIEIDPNIYYSEVSQEQQKQQTIEYSKTIEDIVNNTNISYYDFNVINHFRSPIESIKIKDNNLTFYSVVSPDIYEQRVEQFNNGELIITTKIKSTRNMIPKDFQLENAVLVEGRMFTQEEIDNGENVCLVNERMTIHTQNYQLYVQVGDTITVSELIRDDNGNVIYYEPHEFKVIGLYKKGEGRQIISSGLNTGESPIYIPEKQFQAIYENSSQKAMEYNPDYFINHIMTRYELSNAIFKVDTIKDYRFFLDYLDNYSEKFNSGYKFTSTMDDVYPAISSVLSVSNTINYVSMICLVVCVVITFIIILFEIDGSKKDIGILLSMGESMKSVIVQYIMELLLISLLATSFSFVITQKIGVNIISLLVQNNAKNEIVISNELDISIEKGEYDEILKPLTIGDSIDSIILYVILIIGFQSASVYYLVKKIDPKELMKDE